MLAKGWIDGRPVKLIWFRHEACLKGLHGKPVRQTGEWRLSCWTVASLQRRIHRRRRVDRGRRRRKHGAPTGAADAAGGDRRVRSHAGCGSLPYPSVGTPCEVGGEFLSAIVKPMYVRRPQRAHQHMRTLQAIFGQTLCDIQACEILVLSCRRRLQWESLGSALAFL